VDEYGDEPRDGEEADVKDCAWGVGIQAAADEDQCDPEERLN
jgi:hypothetical protein